MSRPRLYVTSHSPWRQSNQPTADEMTLNSEDVSDLHAS